MKIDIKPQIEVANEIDRLCIDMREIKALYVIRLASGIDLSVKWDEKGLAEFLPNRTVSEMLVEFEASILARYNEAMRAVKTGLHPTWTVQKKEMIILTGGVEYPTGKLLPPEPQQLDRYAKASFRREAEDRKKEFGKLSFIKIC